MKTFYNRLKRKAILCFLLLPAISINALSQVTTCSNTATPCVGTVVTFNAGPSGFTSPGSEFVYNSGTGDFRVSSTNNNTDYILLSPSYTTSVDDVINVGFTTEGSTATLNSYTIEVVRVSDGVVIASCVGPSAPPNITAGAICYTITDADIDPNVALQYRFTIRTGGGSNNALLVFDNFIYVQSQQVLPVTFSRFTATRNDTRVSLKWQTPTESNNRLFEVQRRTTRNDFETVASVPSKAPNGNSSALLSYEYEDLNNFKGSSYYRIRQVDRDGKSTYSQIRIITNVTGDKILVYPNPSTNGTVSVTFNSTEPRHVDLVDNTGRIVQQWKSYTDQDLKISKLSIGVYLLKTKNLQTSEQSIHRIVITQ
jgi:hypothetical protein